MWAAPLDIGSFVSSCAISRVSRHGQSKVKEFVILRFVTSRLVLLVRSSGVNRIAEDATRTMRATFENLRDVSITRYANNIDDSHLRWGCLPKTVTTSYRSLELRLSSLFSM